ncbi:hypothetical protein D3C72_1558400 [compost metagenome]
MLLAFRDTGAHYPNQGCTIGNLGAVLFISRPVGAQHQGDTVAVLAVHQHIFVHQQINQGQRLGEENDDEHQPKGAGEEALGEPNGGFHG